MIMKFLVINKIEIDIQIFFSFTIICKMLHNSKENGQENSLLILIYFKKGEGRQIK